jgi:hypothetical protein
LAKQLIVDQKNIADVNWAEAGGAAAGGFVAGATLGLAPAGASLFGLAALGGIGGAAGGQVEALTQATLQHYIQKNPQNSVLQDARSLGFLNLETARVDFGTGVASGVIGGGLARLFHSKGMLSESADVITRRGEVPMVRWEKLLDQPGKWTFRMEGRIVVVDADTFERLTRSALQNGLKTAEEVLLEAIEQGMVEVIDHEYTGNPPFSRRHLDPGCRHHFELEFRVDDWSLCWCLLDGSPVVCRPSSDMAV